MILVDDWEVVPSKVPGTYLLGITFDGHYVAILVSSANFPPEKLMEGQVVWPLNMNQSIKLSKGNKEVYEQMPNEATTQIG